MRSLVSKLTRPGREKARDTVEDATPAAFATSSIVGGLGGWSTRHLHGRGIVTDVSDLRH
ncbi:hypothetical protein Asp14428_28430 [Actinoplanes sp. NBRC 14428]|nr:hypothetical protein Asp14428_28430 [Actinoplanes sp. NBRC 14428]